jgi:hypothetical protein
MAMDKYVHCFTTSISKMPFRSQNTAAITLPTDLTILKFSDYEESGVAIPYLCICFCDMMVKPCLVSVKMHLRNCRPLTEYCCKNDKGHAICGSL